MTAEQTAAAKAAADKRVAEEAHKESAAFYRRLVERVGSAVQFDFVYYGKAAGGDFLGDYRDGDYRDGVFVLVKEVDVDVFDTSPPGRRILDVRDWRYYKTEAAAAILVSYLGWKQSDEAVASFQDVVVEHLLEPPFVEDAEHGVFSLSPLDIEQWADSYRGPIEWDEVRGLRPAELKDLS